MSLEIPDFNVVSGVLVFKNECILKEVKRGHNAVEIRTHNFIVAFFVSIFSTGVIRYTRENKVVYINKSDCCRWINRYGSELIEVKSSSQVILQSISNIYNRIKNRNQNLPIFKKHTKSILPKKIVDLTNRYCADNCAQKKSNPPVLIKTSEFLDKVTSHSLAEAAIQAGQFYKEGLREVCKDLAKARGLFEKAASLGHADATNKVGQFYKEGLGGTPKDLVKAREFFEKAAKECTIYGGYAAHQLGIIHSQGLGTTRDYVKAAHFLEKAVSWGRKLAAKDLMLLYQIEGNISQFRAWANIYKEEVFKIKKPQIALLGGTLLAIATNIPQDEQNLINANISAALAYREESMRLTNLLKTEGTLDSAESVAFICPRGACAGMSSEFLASFFKSKAHLPDLKSRLIATAMPYETGAGITALTRHVFYVHQADKVAKTNLRNYIFTKNIFEPSIPVERISRIMRSARDQAAIRPIYKIHGQKLVSLPELGAPGDYSDKDCLDLWLHPAISDGCYEMSIKDKDGYHVMVLIKEAGKVYIWDPAYGLIECPTTEPAAMMTKYLAANYLDVSNHHLDIRRVESLVGSFPHSAALSGWHI